MRDIEWMKQRVRVNDRGCWVWTKTTDKDGYGKIGGVGSDKNHRAHRVMYCLCVGPIADGNHVDHLCNVEGCINPDHLEQVTPKENSKRIVDRGRHPNASKTVCLRGHDDWRTKKGGHRSCKQCERDREAKRVHKRP